MWSWLSERLSNIFGEQGCQTAPEKHLGSSASTKVTVLYARVNIEELREAENRENLRNRGIRLTQTRQPVATVASAEAPETLANHPTRKGRATRAARFSRRFSDMKPREARMLFSIHRRRLAQLASESPAALHRDLCRFSVSSKGQTVVGNYPIPTCVRVRQWVEEAKAMSRQATENGQHVRV